MWVVSSSSHGNITAFYGKALSSLWSFSFYMRTNLGVGGLDFEP